MPRPTGNDQCHCERGNFDLSMPYLKQLLWLLSGGSARVVSESGRGPIVIPAFPPQPCRLPAKGSSPTGWTEKLVYPAPARYEVIPLSISLFFLFFICFLFVFLFFIFYSFFHFHSYLPSNLLLASRKDTSDVLIRLPNTQHDAMHINITQRVWHVHARIISATRQPSRRDFYIFAQRGHKAARARSTAATLTATICPSLRLHIGSPHSNRIQGVGGMYVVVSNPYRGLLQAAEFHRMYTPICGASGASTGHEPAQHTGFDRQARSRVGRGILYAIKRLHPGKGRTSRRTEPGRTARKQASGRCGRGIERG